MKYKKQKIEIINERYFDKIELFDNCIKLYSNNKLMFIVYNNSKVRANGSSMVNAYERSTIDAFNNSTVRANDSSTVNAYDNSAVGAFYNSTVYAYNHSTVGAYTNSKVDAHDNSKVDANERSIVNAFYNSTINAYGYSIVYAFGNSTVVAKNDSTIEAYDNSKVYARDSSKVYAKNKSTIHAHEFSIIYARSNNATINTNSHFGTIINPIFKVKKNTLVYKRLQADKIATLKLIKGQICQSESFNKCRTDKAFVVKITDITNTKKYKDGVSIYDKSFIYEVGKEVVANKYNKNIDECSNGIHFFLARDKAEKY